MKKYCFITDEKLGLVQLGAGCPDEYYIEIGMEKRDVKQSDIDYQWYLTSKCPMKTKEQKEKEAKEAKIYELKAKLNDIDLKSIRAIRTNDVEYLKKYEEEAQALRDELNKLN